MVAPDPNVEPQSIVRFTGDDGAFRRLVTRGAFLEIVTFGFYRFWLVTDIRRHLWSNTEIDGDAPEYTGRGRELLLGFLFALAVLLPVFLLYFLAGLWLERFQAFASIPLYLVLYGFGQYATFRARRYRLSRTIWRGVRFWMTGSGWAYAWRSLLWGLLAMVTLGFVYPWREAVLERYKMDNSFFGDLPARFSATGAQLFGKVWWVWLLGLLPPLLVYGGLVALVVAEKMHLPKDDVSRVAAVIAMAVGGCGLVALPFLHGVRVARQWHWWVSGIRIGDAKITSKLDGAALIGIYWTMIGQFVLWSLLFGVAIGVVTAIIGATLGQPANLTAAMGSLSPWHLVPYVVLYMALVQTLGVVMRIYLQQRIWKVVVGSCALVNVAALANAAAAGMPASAFGEGLADGLDVAGF